MKGDVSRPATPSKPAAWPRRRSASSRPRAEPARLPATVNEYRLGEPLGQGAFGRVYRAEHLPTGAPVAVKVYAKSSLTRTREASVKNEVSVLLRVDHPNLVKLIDCFVDDERIYIVMELLEGENLHAVFRRGLAAGEARERFARAVLRQLADALAYLHARGVNHRDVKLDNVVLDRRSGAVKLIDFGFSRRLRAGAAERLHCGTPSYMAPEAVRGEPSACLPADVWAAGVVYHCLLAGAFPFRGATETALFGEIAARDPPLCRASEPLRRCLEKDWRRRISAAELAALLSEES